MPAQYVKPYVKPNKSDYIDAEAVAEAVQRPTMRFVSIKTEEQLDLQAVHRVRERWVMRKNRGDQPDSQPPARTWRYLIQGRSHLEQALPPILVEANLKLSDSFRILLAQLKLELEQLTARIEQMNSVIQHTVKRERGLPAAHDHPRSRRQLWSRRSATGVDFGEVSTKIVCPRSTHRNAASSQTLSWTEQLVSSAAGPHSRECRHCGAGE